MDAALRVDDPGGDGLTRDDVADFNLVTQPWIPVLWNDGTTSRVGIWDALTVSGSIRGVAASNPMDNVSLFRFLLAVLQWCKPSLTEEERASLEGAAGIPKEWLAKLRDGKESFYLLGEGERFYQDPGVQGTNNRPVGDLLVEFPTETKIAHFRHVRDGQYGFCPACCALGLVRFCAFANAYGGGRYTSAVNGPAPAYRIAQGRALVESLCLHWPYNRAARRQAPWLDQEAPDAARLDVVTVMAWRSRRLWLGDERGDAADCAYCGETGRAIRRLAFTGNWPSPFEAQEDQKRFWIEDPHVVMEETASAGTRGGKRDALRTAGQPQRPVTALGFPAPGLAAAVHARFWRRVQLASGPERAGRGVREGSSRVYVGGAVVNKGLYQDASSLTLAGQVDDSAMAALWMQSAAVRELMGILHRSTPNPKREHPNRRAALDAHSPSMEALLRRDFDSWCSDAPGRADAPRDASVPCQHRLRAAIGPTLRAVVRATTAGSPLRRRAAVASAVEALDRALARLSESGGSGPSAGVDPDSGEGRDHDGD